MYHGWRYDGSGLCTDIPAEKQPRSRPIRIPGYPVHEYCGVVFAYLGAEPVPTFNLPRKEILETKGRSTLVHKSVWTATGSSTSKTLSMRYMSVSLTCGAASGNSDRW